MLDGQWDAAHDNEIARRILSFLGVSAKRSLMYGARSFEEAVENVS